MARRSPRAPYVFRGHVLDEFQIQAAIAIQQDMSTLVSAPTGTGKSLIADYLVDEMLQRGRRVIYTAPIKALVNQKYREFRELYGASRTGIQTGDLSLNPTAPLVVMTTEVLRNRLLSGGGQPVEPAEADGHAEQDDQLADRGAWAVDQHPGPAAAAAAEATVAAQATLASPADWVVFDEIHYLDHPQRGTVWEEAMLLLPRGCRILGLSATVPNIQQIAAWLEAVHGEPVATVVHTERAVPLRHRYFTDTGQLVDYAAMWQHLTGQDLKAGTVSVSEAAAPPPPGLAGRQPAQAPDRPARALGRRRERPSERPRSSEPTRGSTHLELVAFMQRNGLFPAIYFVLSRREAERMARDLARRRDFLRPHEREAVRVTVRHILQQVGLTPAHIPGLDAMAELWSRGVGVHHAGLLPIVKHIVEHLLERRILRIVYATETFAVGVNMPVRTVCFDSLEKFDGRHYRLLTQQEYMQMAGRAGRRGLDREGTVICRADPGTLLKAGLRDWETERLEPLTSRFTLSYTTVLNLLHRHGGLNESLRQCLRATLRCFQAEKPGEAAAQLEEEFAERADVLARLGYLENGALTSKGQFCRRIWVKELLVTEMAFDGTLEALAPDELAGWAAAVVWEPRPQDASLPRAAPGWMGAAQLAADRIVRTAGPQGREMGRVEGRIAPVLQRWAAGDDWQELLRHYPLEAGDFVALCRQAVDLLRQVKGAGASPLLRDVVDAAIAAVDRDVVRASRLF